MTDMTTHDAAGLVEGLREMIQNHRGFIQQNPRKYKMAFESAVSTVETIVETYEAFARRSQVPPVPVGEGASPDLIAQIARLLAADPVCGGRVASGTIEAIAGICSQVPPVPVGEVRKLIFESLYHLRLDDGAQDYHNRAASWLEAHPPVAALHPTPTKEEGL